METKDIQEICDDCCDNVDVNNEYIRRVFQWLIDSDYIVTKSEK